MILTRIHVAIVAVAAAGIAAGLFFEISEGRKLRSEVRGRSTLIAESKAALEVQVAAQSRRTAEAEAKVASLLEKAKESAVVRAAATKSGGTINADEVVKAVIASGAQLIKAGKFQEALDGYLTGYRELQGIRPGSSECQRLMGAIKSLGRTYPAALAALAGLRDAAMTQWQAQPGRRELPFEIALLNERLGEGSRTLALFDALPPNDRARQSLAMVANSSFIEARRYNEALVGKPFAGMLAWIEAGSSEFAKPGALHQEAIRKATVEGTLTNIEVLTGAGKVEEARVLTEKLLAFDGSDATRVRLKQHIERASHPDK